MDVTRGEEADAAIEESGKSINRLRDLVDDLRFVTELEQKVIATDPVIQNDRPAAE